MAKTRIIIILVAVIVIAALFFLPKSVVENENQLQSAADTTSTTPEAGNPHKSTSQEARVSINRLRARYLSTGAEEKNAIFADSLADLYKEAGLFDSAAWFAERATFSKTTEGLMKVGNAYYDAYTFTIEKKKQQELAEKAREWLGKVLENEPDNLDAKTKIAMTYLTSSAPMKGIKLLREVLETDPSNEPALFNMGMLSIQSGQHDKAVEWLEKLIAVNDKHLQGQLLLGVAYMNQGKKDKARQQFEKVKKLDADPSVQATADSYLKELK
jgi:tetratricopeptide (TPR) repeat protein